MSDTSYASGPTVVLVHGGIAVAGLRSGVLIDRVAASKDSLLTTALKEYQYPAGPGGETATEVIIDPLKFRAVFTADLPQLQSDVYALLQRPIAAAAFSDAD